MAVKPCDQTAGGFALLPANATIISFRFRREAVQSSPLLAEFTQLRGRVRDLRDSHLRRHFGIVFSFLADHANNLLVNFRLDM